MPEKEWSPKRERQYEHIKKSEMEKRGPPGRDGEAHRGRYGQ